MTPLPPPVSSSVQLLSGDRRNPSLSLSDSSASFSLTLGINGIAASFAHDYQSPARCLPATASLKPTAPGWLTGAIMSTEAAGWPRQWPG